MFFGDVNYYYYFYSSVKIEQAINSLWCSVWAFSMLIVIALYPCLHEPSFTMQLAPKLNATRLKKSWDLLRTNNTGIFYLLV